MIMIVGYDKQRLKLIIEDLEFTAKSSKGVAESYKASLQKHPEQTQWREVIGKAEARAKLAQQVIDKLNELIQE